MCFEYLFNTEILPFTSVENCSICLDDMVHSMVVLTDCNHLFHYTCLMSWVKTRNFTCPYCRCEIVSKPQLSTTNVNDERNSWPKRLVAQFLNSFLNQLGFIDVYDSDETDIDTD